MFFNYSPLKRETGEDTRFYRTISFWFKKKLFPITLRDLRSLDPTYGENTERSEVAENHNAKCTRKAALIPSIVS